MTRVRTILVGDVHGCAAELEALLDTVAFSTGDRLVFVGDLVARGPDSLRVLDLARTTGAIVVRGNHEQRLLDGRDGLARSSDGPTQDATSKSLGKIHRELGLSLRPVDWSLLASSKPWLDLPEHDLRVVHAGLDPSVPFEHQAPETLMRIRTVAQEDGTHVLWGTRYVGPPHVVFGHNAAPGLQLHPWATGLDTGCVYGGRLTALVLASGERVPRSVAARRALLVSQPARRVWFSPGDEARTAR